MSEKGFKLDRELKYGDFKERTKMGMPVAHIRYKGVWDMQDLYEFMINFMRERKYKFHEKIYKHKAPSPFGVERQYCWEASSVIDDVYTFVIQIYIHTYDAQDIPVTMKDGSQKLFTRGRLWMSFHGHVKMYEEHDWRERPFFAKLLMFMNDYILRKKHGWEVWDVLWYREVHKLIWLTRRRLKMENNDFEQKDWTGVHG